MTARKTAYEKENANLKAEIRRLKTRHRQMLNAKNLEIESLRCQTPVGIKTLFGSYENLRALLTLLDHVRDLADPMAGMHYDPDREYVTEDSLHDRPIEGQGTQRDRERLQLVNRKINKCAAEIESLLGVGSDEAELGPPAYRDTIVVGGLQCWRRDCRDEKGEPTRGRRQAWDNEVCQWCHREFGTYERHPFMNDVEV